MCITVCVPRTIILVRKMSALWTVPPTAVVKCFIKTQKPA